LAEMIDDPLGSAIGTRRHRDIHTGDLSDPHKNLKVIIYYRLKKQRKSPWMEYKG
jgi:hypothetical protein